MRSFRFCLSSLLHRAWRQLKHSKALRLARKRSSIASSAITHLSGVIT